MSVRILRTDTVTTTHKEHTGFNSKLEQSFTSFNIYYHDPQHSPLSNSKLCFMGWRLKYNEYKRKKYCINFSFYYIISSCYTNQKTPPLYHLEFEVKI